MITLTIRTLVCNAASAFSGVYGAVTHRAQQAGCSRQTVYDHARQVEQRLHPAVPVAPAAEVSVPTPVSVLDEPTRRRFAVTAFAMGISTRQIEELLHIPLGEDGPDHSTIARWVEDAAEKAKLALEVLDAACVLKVHTLAVDEIFFGGGRPWLGSSPPA